MGKSKDLATLKSGLSIDGTLETTSVGTNLTSNSYNIVRVQTDKDDTAAADGILQFTHGSSNTVKGEIRYDASESMFELGHGDNQGHVRIDGSGRVTKPSQPAFRVYRSSNANYTSMTTVVYDSVSYNRGNHYNASNGFFTAPVAGVYQFGTYHWHNTNTGGQSKLQMFKNSSMVFEFVESRSSSMNYYTRVGFHHEILLAANDVVKVMAGGVSGGQLHTSSGVGYSYFAGHLIS